MKLCKVDYQSSDGPSSKRVLCAVEGKSMPTTSTRKQMRRRFGYLLALTLIGVGALLNLRLLIPTFAIASAVSLSVVGIAVIVQMPMRFLRSRYHQRNPAAADSIVKA